MTMRAKILGGFVLVSVIGLILGAVGLISARMQTDMSSELYALQNSDKGVSTVLNAHYIWRQGLTESVLAGSEFTGSLDPQTCALGKWKGSEEAQNITDPEIIALLSRIDEPHSFIHNEAKTLMEMLSSGDSAEAKRELLEVILPRTQEVITILTSMEERFAVLTEEKSANIVELGNRMTLITVVLVIFSAIACVLLAWRITAGIMKPLQKITLAAERIAVGDLDVSVSYNVNDQIGRLARSFQNLADNTKEQVSAAEALADGDLTVEIMPRSEKDVMNFALGKMISNLNNMFEEIQGSAMQVSAGSKQLSSGAQSLAQGSTEQASAVEELSASVSEIANKTKQNANIAKEAADLSSVIRENAEKGNSQMEYMMQAVKEINEASRQIEKVIKVIDDIAFQTNILALNAAVEAARAGSAGKGFAVVAEEVRNLAAKSAEAAKDTGGLIENSVAKANLGLTIATQTSASLKEIVEGINRSAGIVTQIALLSDEQAGAIIQVNTGIDQVAQVVQQNSATAQESAAASEEMNGQSNMLEQLISQFKLKNAVGQRALGSGAAMPLRPPELPQGAVCALPESDADYRQY